MRKTNPTPRPAPRPGTGTRSGASSAPAHAVAVDPAGVATVRAGVLDAEDAGRLSALLSLMADPVRVRLLDALERVEEMSVGDLALALDISEDAASYGLRLLRTAGLLRSRRDGRLVRYRLTDRFPEPLLEHCMRELLHLSRLAAGIEPGPDPRSRR